MHNAAIDASSGDVTHAAPAVSWLIGTLGRSRTAMRASLAKQIFVSLWPYRWMLSLAFTQIMLASAAELLKPWPLQLIIDHVLDSQPLVWPMVSGWSRDLLLLAACGGLVGIYLGLGGLNICHNYTIIRIGQSLERDLRAALYHHLQHLSPAFHQRHRVGDLLYRVMIDTGAIQTLVRNGLFPLLSSLVLMVSMVLVMLRLDWLLTLLALGVCPPLLVALYLLNPYIDGAAAATRESESALHSLVLQTMAAIRVIQAFTREKHEHRRLMVASAKNLSTNVRLNSLLALYFGIIEVAIALGAASVVWIGARHVLAGTLSVGELIVFIAYLGSLYGPIVTISRSLGLIAEAKAGLARVYTVLSVECHLPEGRRVFSAHGMRGEVRFESVTFGYAPGVPVLRDVDLHVAAGQTVAIVGPTGVGKSTLVGLLPRFGDPQEGRVLLDGIDVREYTLPSLRQCIAMVLQPPVVFPATVRENIAYGRPGASLEAVMRAARLACMHETIMRLPQGYDTIVGEQGATLSEGERQRLTVARAVLRDAPILILDEPTSALDAETEAIIMQGLTSLTVDRTVFIIAHRLSTVQKADMILVLQDGRIVEQGSFAELMRRQEAFAKLYYTQFGRQEVAQRAASQERVGPWGSRTQCS